MALKRFYVECRWHCACDDRNRSCKGFEVWIEYRASITRADINFAGKIIRMQDCVDRNSIVENDWDKEVSSITAHIDVFDCCTTAFKSGVFKNWSTKITVRVKRKLCKTFFSVTNARTPQSKQWIFSKYKTQFLFIFLFIKLYSWKPQFVFSKLHLSTNIVLSSQTSFVWFCTIGSHKSGPAPIQAHYKNNFQLLLFDTGFHLQKVWQNFISAMWTDRCGRSSGIKPYFLQAKNTSFV